MANRGRDLELSIISNANQFDLDKPAAELDQLGDAATTSAKKIDTAFDRISSSSRTSSRKVESDLDKGKKGLDEFKDEANSTAKESAASFSGSFDDIAGTVQEVAANAFAGFGKLGGIAGLAAAAGIGILTQSIAAAQEKINELRDGLAQLFEAGEAGPREKLQQFFETYKDDLAHIREDLRDAGISQQEYFDAIASGGPRLEAVQRKLDDYYDTQGAFEQKVGHTINITHDWVNTMKEAEIQGESNKAALGRQTDSIVSARKATETLAQAMQDVGAGSDVMTSAIETSATRQAAATKSTEDSWTDYKDTALASIDDVIAKQLEQLAATQNFEANTNAVLARLGQDAVDWALSQGENADKAMQLLATAPVAKGQQVVDNFRKLGQQTSEATAAGMLQSKGAQTAAVDEIRGDMQARAAAAPVTIPVDVQGPTRSDVNAEVLRIKANLPDFITVPVMLQAVPKSRWQTGG